MKTIEQTFQDYIKEINATNLDPLVLQLLETTYYVGIQDAFTHQQQWVQLKITTKEYHTWIEEIENRAEKPKP